jgi:hypothetical protein
MSKKSIKSTTDEISSGVSTGLGGWSARPMLLGLSLLALLLQGFGLALAQGQSLEQAVQSLGHVAEGVYSARTVLQRARSLDVDMPITENVVALLDSQLTTAQAVQALMGRGPRGEAV